MRKQKEKKQTYKQTNVVVVVGPGWYADYDDDAKDLSNEEPLYAPGTHQENGNALPREYSYISLPTLR